ncbi:MAG TPA: SPOR domain-containing protein [Bacteroidaceae bacterium]|nr:SPOR domain-containing protein [Bacteroidaceae bacterium]
MKKFSSIGLVVCLVLAMTSCKTQESAYKKAYLQAQENQKEQAVEVTSTATAPVSTPASTTAPSAAVRQEKISVVHGDDVKAYSVVVGSFGVKNNAQNLVVSLKDKGYNPTLAFNAAKATYRVVLCSYDTYDEAAAARDAFKQKFSDNKDFQGSWLLYRVY